MNFIVANPARPSSAVEFLRSKFWTGDENNKVEKGKQKKAMNQ